MAVADHGRQHRVLRGGVRAQLNLGAIPAFLLLVIGGQLAVTNLTKLVVDRARPAGDTRTGPKRHDPGRDRGLLAAPSPGLSVPS